MRFLLVLTVLMLTVAAGVWWKTARVSEPAPDALANDPNLGAATFGVLPERPAPLPTKEPRATPASLERETPEPAPAGAPLGAASAADAVAPGSALKPAGGGDPPEPQSAANEKPAPPAAAGAVTHAVRSGETFYRIVLRAYGTAPPELIDAVAKANGLRDPSQIREGQQLKLPSLAGWPAPKRP